MRKIRIVIMKCKQINICTRDTTFTATIIHGSTFKATTTHGTIFTATKYIQCKTAVQNNERSDMATLAIYKLKQLV